MYKRQRHYLATRFRLSLRRRSVLRLTVTIRIMTRSAMPWHHDHHYPARPRVGDGPTMSHSISGGCAAAAIISTGMSPPLTPVTKLKVSTYTGDALNLLVSHGGGNLRSAEARGRGMTTSHTGAASTAPARRDPQGAQVQLRLDCHRPYLRRMPSFYQETSLECIEKARAVSLARLVEMWSLPSIVPS